MLGPVNRGPAQVPAQGLISSGPPASMLNPSRRLTPPPRSVLQPIPAGAGAAGKILAEHRDELEALKRISRETAQDVLMLRAAHEATGGAAAGARGAGPADAGPTGGGGGGGGGLGRRARFSGEIYMGHGAQPASSSDASRAAASGGLDLSGLSPSFAQEEGLDVGGEVKVRAEVGQPTRGPLYSLVQCAASLADPVVRLDKLLFRTAVRPGASVAWAPRGCAASDTTPTLVGLGRGHGLTESTRLGCPTYQLAEGPGAALQLDLPELGRLGPGALSVSAHVRAPDPGAPPGIVQSFLAQVAAAPSYTTTVSAFVLGQRLDATDDNGPGEARTGGRPRDLVRDTLPVLARLVASAVLPRSRAPEGTTRTRLGAAFCSQVGSGELEISGWGGIVGDHACRLGGRGVAGGCANLARALEAGVKVTRPLGDGVLTAALARGKPSAACADEVLADDLPDRTTVEVSLTHPLRDGPTLTSGLVATVADNRGDRPR